MLGHGNGTKHLERTQEFVELVLARTDNEQLLSRTDKGKTVFIDRLKAAD